MEETRQKFKDSTKLRNLLAACYIGKREFSKAEKLLIQVYKFFENNPELTSAKEMNGCLRNLVIV